MSVVRHVIGKRKGTTKKFEFLTHPGFQIAFRYFRFRVLEHLSWFALCHIAQMQKLTNVLVVTKNCHSDFFDWFSYPRESLPRGRATGRQE